MSGRISEERLEAKRSAYAMRPADRDMVSALSELQQSRALVAELRALADEMSEYIQLTLPANPVTEARIQTTGDWMYYINALLASHGAAQTEQK